MLSTLSIVSGCKNQSQITGETEQSVTNDDRYKTTDALVEAISGNLSDFEIVVVIDHSRLAAKEGVAMPPATVTIYSDPKVNTPLMKLNPRVGLDLPQKILVYEEAGEPTITYSDANFLSQRHGINDQTALQNYDSAMESGLRGLDDGLLDIVTGKGVTRDYGIQEIASDFTHPETIERLKNSVMSQGDTVWFGEVDFKMQAASSGVELRPAMLLLFGGPKPGGVAMAKFPKLGLDAFCQKLLVYVDDAENVKVIFNDIVAMANLQYGTSDKSHKMINGRLTKTFENAVQKSDQ